MTIPTDAELSPPVGSWQDSTVVAIRDETATAKSFRLRLAHSTALRPGQHFIVRLTAPDGYTAQRSYSVATPPDEQPEIELTVERLVEGEVSVFLHDEVMVGDELEVRGPVGNWFVWDDGAPALLLGGGSGIVPLMAMLRHARHRGQADLLRMVVSVRSPDDLYYGAELHGPETSIVYTRRAPPGSDRSPGRLGSHDVAPVLRPGDRVYVCGSSGFADAATDLVMSLGVPAEEIRVERFGPTG